MRARCALRTAARRSCCPAARRRRRAPTRNIQEYPRLYAHFADLVGTGRADADLAPMRLVADAFLLATRETCEAFAF